MGTVDDVARRKPAPKVEHKPAESENDSHRDKKPSSEPGFLGRRIQLGATTSTTMGIVLMFPVLVIVLIMVIFARSPGSDNVMEMPSDTATSIRYVYRLPRDMYFVKTSTGRSAKSTINLSRWVALSHE